LHDIHRIAKKRTALKKTNKKTSIFLILYHLFTRSLKIIFIFSNFLIQKRQNYYFFLQKKKGKRKKTFTRKSPEYLERYLRDVRRIFSTKIRYLKLWKMPKL